VIALKPGRCERRLPAGIDQFVDVASEDGGGQHALDPTAR
jgi:hypothetical protein